MAYIVNCNTSSNQQPLVPYAKFFKCFPSSNQATNCWVDGSQNLLHVLRYVLTKFVLLHTRHQTKNNLSDKTAKKDFKRQLFKWVGLEGETFIMTMIILFYALPRIFMPCGERSTPPTSNRSRAFFTSSCPQISGAMLDASLSQKSSSATCNEITK